MRRLAAEAQNFRRESVSRPQERKTAGATHRIAQNISAIASALITEPARADTHDD